VLVSLGVNVQDEIADRTTLFQQLVTERSEVQELNFVKRLAEALTGQEFTVDSDRPPQGALQTSGPSALHPLATVCAGTEHATAVDSGAFSRKVMVEDQYDPWLFGAANPPDPTAGEQLSVVDPIALDFVVGTDGAISIEFGVSPGAEDSLRSDPGLSWDEGPVRAAAMGELNKSLLLLPFLGVF